MMKTLLVSLLLIGGNAAIAADTSTAEPTTAQRVLNARQAIQTQDWQAAITELRTAVKEEPNNADAHNLLAYSFRKQSKPDLPQAFEHYRIALKLNPNHKGAHEYIGEAYLMDKNPADAEKHLVELERICGNKVCEEYVDLARAIAQYKLQK